MAIAMDMAWVVVVAVAMAVVVGYEGFVGQ